MIKPLSSRWVTRLLIALIVVESLSWVSSAMQLHLLNNLPVTEEAATANDNREALMGIAFLVTYIVTMVFFGCWIVSAHKTVRSLGAEGMTISPGWAVGYYFIPFINLVRPYTAMKELWMASVDPQHASSQTVPSFLSGWWALWIINGVVGQIIFRMSKNAEGIEMLKVLTVMNLVGGVLGVALSLVAIKLVKGITGNVARAHAIQTMPPELIA
jgi:hypothetical protein